MTGAIDRLLTRSIAAPVAIRPRPAGPFEPPRLPDQSSEEAWLGPEPRDLGAVPSETDLTAAPPRPIPDPPASRADASDDARGRGPGAEPDERTGTRAVERFEPVDRARPRESGPLATVVVAPAVGARASSNTEIGAVETRAPEVTPRVPAPRDFGSRVPRAEAASSPFAVPAERSRSSLVAERGQPALVAGPTRPSLVGLAQRADASRPEPTIAASPTVVHVEIGRIEVKAEPAVAPRRRDPKPARSANDLDRYLRQRATGDRA